MTYEVDTPILNFPFDRPDLAASPPENHYFIQEEEPPQLREGRRPAIVISADRTSKIQKYWR